jgi:hypothetical protein
MPYTELAIWVEGDDDVRFVDRIIGPLVNDLYSHMRTVMYKQSRTEWVNDFIETYRQENRTYVFCRDIDRYPCITSRRESVSKEYARLEWNNIVVVRAMIESWYVGGHGEEALKKLSRTAWQRGRFDNCEWITKEHFNKMIERLYGNRVNAMQEMLREYSLQLGLQRCPSLRYLCRKIGLDV